MELTDTHAHLFLGDFDDDRDAVVQNAVRNGVTKIFLPNIDESTIQPMHRMTEQYPGRCFAMMGLHPCSVDDEFENVLQRMEEHLLQFDYAAIGETGLDHHHDMKWAEAQEAALKQQLEWAKKYRLPVVLHSRKSTEATYQIVRDAYTESLTGVFHCYGEDAALARKITDMGFYIGIGGVLTFKNSNLREVVKELPVDRIVLETDAPYLAPHPYRGKRNESAYIRDIANVLATVKNITIEEVAKATTENALNLYRNHNTSG